MDNVMVKPVAAAALLLVLLGACRSPPLYDLTVAGVVGEYEHPVKGEKYVLMIWDGGTFEYMAVKNPLIMGPLIRPGSVRIAQDHLHFYTRQEYWGPVGEQVFRVSQEGSELCLVPVEGNIWPWTMKLWRVGPPQRFHGPKKREEK